MTQAHDAVIAGSSPFVAKLLAPLTEKGSLSELERFALRGGAMPVEPGPVRRAAALRWQVEAALQSAPAAGSPVDSAALAAILGGIDETLASLVDLAEAAPPDWRPPIEALRHVLVKEAIDFTEAVHRIAPAQPLGVPQPIRRAAGARVLSVTAAPKSAKPPRVPAMLWVVLAVAAVGAAAFHGWRYVRQQQGFAHPPAMGGAPSLMAGNAPGKVKLLTSQGGKPPDPVELARFRAQEELKGNTVKELAPGRLAVLPAEVGRRMEAPKEAKP